MKRRNREKVADAIYKFVKKRFEKDPYVSVVVAAGGSSSRMGGINKLFAELSGIPVLAITLSALNSSKYVNEIILVSSENDFIQASELCKRYAFSKVSKVIKGGATRLLSVYNGVREVSDKAEIIAIHDGARPFVTEKIIKDTVKAAAEYGAAAPFVPVKDTVKTGNSGFVSSTLKRDELYAVQTPQAFDAGLIKAALYNAVKKDLPITDDCSSVEAIGGAVRLVEGSYDNIKITTPEDLIIGDAIFNAEVNSK